MHDYLRANEPLIGRDKKLIQQYHFFSSTKL